MALQLHKDSIDISSNDVTSDTTQPNVNGNHSVTMIQNVDPRNNPTHLHSNDRNNLQALLHLSTSLHTTQGRTNSNDESHTIGQMDAEKELFLKEVLKSLSTDIVGHIKNLIGTLTQVESIPKEECESVLEELMEHVCCIDIAKCFYQLGGLKVITPLLKHKKCKVRSLAARIISECCQNNPFCQELTVSDDVFSPLYEVAKNDEDHTARFHAFSAISAIVRDNPEGLKQFKKYEGFILLKDALKLLNTRITAKISFFISYLSELDQPTKDDLVKADVVPALIETITTSNDTYPVQALLSLMSNHPQAVKQACQNDTALREYITSTLSENDDSEADRELVECCSKIAQLMDESVARSQK